MLRTQRPDHQQRPHLDFRKRCLRDLVLGGQRTDQQQRWHYNDGVFTTRSIYALSAGAQISNSGDIVTTGSFGRGIYTVGTGAQINNSGYIRISDGYGIVLQGANTTLTNSGTIISEKSNAIEYCMGRRHAEPAGRKKHSGRHSFRGTRKLNAEREPRPEHGADLGWRARLLLNTYGAPMAIQGALVAVVDPTGFSAQDECLTLLLARYPERSTGVSMQPALGMCPYQVLSWPNSSPMPRWAHRPWTSATEPVPALEQRQVSGPPVLTPYRDQDADGVDVGFDSSLGGLLDRLRQ